VRDAARSYRTLEIEAADRAAARLFAGWLAGCLSWTEGAVRIADAPADATTPLSKVRLTGDGPALTLRVQNTWLEAEVAGAGGVRIVPLGDRSLASRFVEEIGVRTRDAAFECALVAAMETRS
jgi:glucose-6-phosphate dehydrogenase assembly protein OpcA